jgi:hypothetical protein
MATIQGADVPAGGDSMPRLARHILVTSPLVALALELLLTTAVAAASGGGDFPVWRR